MNLEQGELQTGPPGEAVTAESHIQEIQGNPALSAGLATE